MIAAIGWASSFILLLTIGTQVGKQWKEHTVKGVSRWLYVGQIAASIGFTAYSWLLHNWIFVVTNALMLCSAVIGIVIYVRNKRETARGK
ncbi:MAG: hypothetical protein NVSMB1_13450 [Polyangiales bacterium]